MAYGLVDYYYQCDIHMSEFQTNMCEMNILHIFKIKLNNTIAVTIKGMLLLLSFFLLLLFRILWLIRFLPTNKIQLIRVRCTYLCQFREGREFFDRELI